VSGIEGTPSWAEVLELVSRLDASGLEDAEIVVPGLRLRVARHPLGDVAAPAAPPAPAPETAPEPAPEPAPEAAEAVGTAVTAPILGTLYLRPSPDADRFVAVGDTVTADTTVAIVEVMKLMNPVPAGVAGTVTEICAAEGAMVEYGQTLMRIQPAAPMPRDVP
jgi:acetyl-CoA carboxylase biotin carboxyl carrier protein